MEAPPHEENPISSHPQRCKEEGGLEPFWPGPGSSGEATVPSPFGISSSPLHPKEERIFHFLLPQLPDPTADLLSRLTSTFSAGSPFSFPSLLPLSPANPTPAP
uniref:Uncharacterized protein n=1 Tax=Populus alba TaxID=43335 RepID=A0A4U5P768_POPAL|nr:hypothetical protein D5086_0000219720 [Populus alba]